MNKQQFTELIKSEPMTENQIELKVQELTNTYYSFYDIKDYLINAADNVGYNNKVIYLSDGWEEIKINFQYKVTEENDVIIYYIK